MKVELEHFSYGYNQELVLQDVSLTLESGSLTVITGLSGCGKSTLCRALCGLVPHYFGGRAAGRISLGQSSVLTSSLAELSPQVSIVLEDYESQLFSLTVREELEYNLICSSNEREAVIEESLALVGLSGLASREVSSLSGGQKQRLAIAGALVKRPQLLILDEPAAALDPVGTTQLYELVNRLCKQGLTVVISEQDPRELMLLADKIVVLEAGKVVFDGKPELVAPLLEQQDHYRRFLPDLWKLRLLLAEDSLPYWKTIEQAQRFLSEYVRIGKVEKSA